jgi:hypothetical protein
MAFADPWEATVNGKQWGLTILTVLMISFSAGCGGSGGVIASQASAPAAPIVSIAGQYHLVLTSSNGRGTTYIYTDFAQTGATFTGAPNTLVCPPNDLPECKGIDFPATSITPKGTISGMNVTIVISYPSAAGADTVTMAGATADGSGLAGTFTDSLGDTGTWGGTLATYQFAAPPGVSDYTGTFNSASNPLLISPTILLEVGEDAAFNSSSILKGSATIMNSPCMNSLTFSGQSIGDAFNLTDAVGKVSIIAVPNVQSDFTFNFSYKFDPTAPSCAGDSGSGVLTINHSPWDY